MKKKNKKTNQVPKFVYVAAALCAVSLLSLLLCLHLTSGRQGEFVPPPFDAAAEQGLPEVPDSLGWAEIRQEGMEFTAAVCGVFAAEDGKADVYFANTSEGAAWLKLCVMNADGEVLGETGLIKPGEYVRSVTLDILPEDGSAVTLRIMAYEPETYYSLGAVKLNTTASVKEPQ